MYSQNSYHIQTSTIQILNVVIGSHCGLIIWFLDLELPELSVPITTNILSSNTAHDKVYPIQHYVIQHPVSSTNKTDCHDIAELLLKVALNTITLTIK